MVGMKRAYRKNILKDITTSKSRFLSIFIIVAIGVSFFAGVRATSPDMKITADKYLDDSNASDLDIYSATGFKKSDIEKVENTDGVEKVYAGYTFDALAVNGESEIPIKVHSLKIGEETVNNPILVDGRLPENNEETVTEKRFLEKEGLKIGSSIELKTKNEVKKFKIVGTVNSSLYMNKSQRGNNSLGNGTTQAFFHIDEETAYELAIPKMPNIPGLEVEKIYNELSVIVKDAKAENYFTDKYNDIVNQVKEKIKDINKDWYVLGRDTNIGIRGFSDDSERIGAIGKVFPLIFFLVATLVCLTSMTRMVEEQRTQIGTFKALGYGKGSIIFHYFIYSFLASIGGSVLGVLVGFRLFPNVIFNAYRIMYEIPDIISPFNVELAVTSTIVAVLCTTLAAIFACAKELIAVPAVLMRPRTPKAGKRILLERVGFIWGRMSFTSKVTARNILRYKKRFFMTIIGISGCTALLVTGFGLKNSIMSITDKQFNEIYKYDMIVQLKSEIEESKFLDFKEDLKDYKTLDNTLMIFQKNIETTNEKDKEIDSYLFIPENKSEIQNFIKLAHNDEDIELPSDGVVITEKLSKLLEVSKGDNIEIKLNDKKVKVKISGITEHYVMNYIYMSPEYYKELFDVPVKYNGFMGTTTDKSKDGGNFLSKDLMKNTDIGSVSFITNTSEHFKQTMGSIDSVVVVLIVSAAALAFVVMYNLTNINISERIRELATIKVLGFYDSEVAAYVYRENVVLSIIGTILGLFLGIGLHRYVVVTAEIDMVMFVRTIKAIDFVHSAILTIVFSGLVNIVMYRRLKKIDMVESLKSAE